MDKEVNEVFRWNAQEEKITGTQKKYLDAVRELGSMNAVARVFSVDVSTVAESLKGAAKRLGLDNHNALYERKKIVKESKLKNIDPPRRKNRSKASVSELVELVVKQDYRCALSGKELSPSDSSLDHIVPFSRGGSDMPENLQWLHKSVNQAKGSMTNDEFIELCRRVVAWNS